uniref:Uncharacterized protein n=1 Tax=Micrurus lemniscatus lemniscatus TaxID=129467 RepID=A0A2D4JTI4_MICLE
MFPYVPINKSEYSQEMLVQVWEQTPEPREKETGQLEERIHTINLRVELTSVIEMLLNILSKSCSLIAPLISLSQGLCFFYPFLANEQKNFLIICILSNWVSHGSKLKKKKDCNFYVK